MKQIQFRQFGPPAHVAECVDAPEPGAPTAWELLVRIEASTINPADLATLAGRYGKLPKLPSQIGMEGFGRVVECGKSVTGFSPGDRVLVLANNNWTQLKKLPASAVVRMPENADPIQLAMLKVNPTTAWNLLDPSRRKNAGEWMIQNAPLSGVGRCVIRLAPRLGWNAIHVVRRESAVAEARAAGATHVLLDDGNLAAKVRQLTGLTPVRVAIDAVGGAATQRLAECLSENGEIINYGMLAGEPCLLGPEQTIFRGIRLSGYWVSGHLNRMSLEQRKEHFENLARLVEDGTLQMPVDSRYGLEEIQTAIRRAEDPARKGKVLLLPSGNLC